MPEDALPDPGAKGGSGWRQEAVPRAPGALLLEGQQQHNRKSRCLGTAAGPECCAVLCCPRGVPSPQSSIPARRLAGGARTTAALHGRGTGAGEQPLAPGQRMQG